MNWPGVEALLPLDFFDPSDWPVLWRKVDAHAQPVWIFFNRDQGSSLAGLTVNFAVLSVLYWLSWVWRAEKSINLKMNAGVAQSGILNWLDMKNSSGEWVHATNHAAERDQA
jgi:hypothetical protein